MQRLEELGDSEGIGFIAEQPGGRPGLTGRVRGHGVLPLPLKAGSHSKGPQRSPGGALGCHKIPAGVNLSASSTGSVAV